MKHSLICFWLSLAGGGVGCASTSSKSAETVPSSVGVVDSRYDRLMNVAEDVSRELLFKPATRDFRTGLLRTEPMVSAQWFEFWRSDVQTPADMAQSSLGKIRRTLRVGMGNLVTAFQQKLTRGSVLLLTDCQVSRREGTGAANRSGRTQMSSRSAGATSCGTAAAGSRTTTKSAPSRASARSSAV